MENELRKIMIDAEYAKELGKNAFDYYSEHCSINIMAKGFIKAISIITWTREFLLMVLVQS